MPMTANNFETRAYRVHNDAAVPGLDANWINPENTPWEQGVGYNFRIRMCTLRYPSPAGISTNFEIGYYKNSAPYQLIGTGGNNIHQVSSPHYAHRDDCLDLLLEGGIGTLLNVVNGNYVAGGNNTQSLTWGPPGNKRMDTEWCLRLVEADVVPGDVFEFEMRRGNGAAFTNSALHVPTMTVVENPESCLHGVLDSRPLASGNLRGLPQAQGKTDGRVLAEGALSGTPQNEGELDTKPQSQGNLHTCRSPK